MTTRFLAIAAAAILCCSGCNDPYSQRRIGMRTQHLAETIDDLGEREQRGLRRLQEEGETLRKWWRSDCERFQRRAATIPDYFW